MTNQVYTYNVIVDGYEYPSSQKPLGSVRAGLLHFPEPLQIGDNITIGDDRTIGEVYKRMPKATKTPGDNRELTPTTVCTKLVFFSKGVKQQDLEKMIGDMKDDN